MKKENSNDITSGGTYVGRGKNTTTKELWDCMDEHKPGNAGGFAIGLDNMKDRWCAIKTGLQILMGALNPLNSSVAVFSYLDREVKETP